MIDGGTIIPSIDGGLISSEPAFQNGYYFGLSSPTLLYETGNMFSINTYSGYDALITISTGIYYKFYQANRDTSLSSNDSLLTGNLGFRLLESPDYKIYDKEKNIFYSTVNQTRYSGVGPNDDTATSSLFNSTPTIISNWGAQENNNAEFTPSGNLLLVYNTSLQESIDIKNYYTGMRTGLVGANILGISCSHYSGVYTNTGNYINNIRAPIHRYIMTGNKPIKYVLLLHGIPSQITGNDHTEETNLNDIYSVSVSYDLSTSLFRLSGYSRPSNFGSEFPRKDFLQQNVSIYNTSLVDIDRSFLFAEYSGNTALFCHLATIQGQTNDLSGYIKHICRDGVVDGPYLKGSGQNNTFAYYYGNPALFNYPGVTPDTLGYKHRSDSFYSSLGVNILMKKPRNVLPYVTGRNVGGFVSDGFHSALYSSDGTWDGISTMQGQWPRYGTRCNFSGYNWYITSHYESYAGKLLIDYEAGGHVPFVEFIRPETCGGTDYSNICVGFVGSLAEPFYPGIEYIDYFDAWFNGRTFIESAYMGLNKRHYGIFGDPLLKWR